MKYKYQTQGTCSREIEITVENDIIENVTFTGGCAGNTKGIESLVRGMKVKDVITRLDGILCKTKPTSCPDQLAKALKSIKNVSQEPI